jgi:hypothetical protein
MGYAWPVQQEPPGRPQRVLPTVRPDEFFGYLYHLDAVEDPAIELSPGSAGANGRAISPRLTNVDDPPLIRYRQGWQAEDRGQGELSRNAWRRWTTDRDLAQVHRQGQGRQQAVLPVAQSDSHAHRRAPVAEVSMPTQNGWSIHEPAWRSLTTTSAW